MKTIKMRWALVVLLMAACVAPVRANVLITLDQGAQIGAPGDTLTFFGSLENTTASELFLTSVIVNTAPELSGDASPFFLGGFLFLTPSFSILAGQTTPSFGLFDIFIPLGTAPGTYSLNNDFALLGGLADTDQGLLGNAAFTVVVPESAEVPEPSMWAMMAAGLGVVAMMRCRGLLRVQ